MTPSAWMYIEISFFPLLVGSLTSHLYPRIRIYCQPLFIVNTKGIEVQYLHQTFNHRKVQKINIR